MIKVLKSPRHLLDVLDFSKFNKISDYRNGAYLECNGQIFYVSHYDNLNALSIKVNRNDVDFIIKGDKTQRLNFIVDSHTEILDLNLGKIHFNDFKLLKEIIKEKNPLTGLNGKNDPLTFNLEILEELSPIYNPNNIIGRGLGLTPSGDDILIGIILILNILKKREELSKIIESADLSRTNKISKNFLEFTFKGYFSESILKLLKEDDIEKNVEEILKTGHTSGADTLLGMYYAINYFKK